MSVIQQVKPLAFSIEKSETLYYNADELKVYNPTYFRGTSKGIRRIVELKKIPPESYIIAFFVKKSKVWNKLDEPITINGAKVLIVKEWVDVNIFNMSSLPTTNTTCEVAPDILLLNDNEKFKDANGNIIEIETRGEKNVDKILFNMNDISRGFNTPNTRRAVIDKDSDYEIGIHYKRLSVLSSEGNSFDRRDECQDEDESILPRGRQTSPRQDESKSVVVKLVYFFTYEGLITYLFRSNNPNKSSFQRWAIQKLFVHQMGSVEEKRALSNELNASIDLMSVALKAQVGEVSCIYLIKIGTVPELKTVYNIPDSVSNDRCVYKYGFTKNFERRIKEHKKSYGKVTKNTLYVVKFAHIDNDFTSNAETDIKHTFDSFRLGLKVEGNLELVALDVKELEEITAKFGDLAIKYRGASKDIRDKIERHDKAIEKMINDHDRAIEKMTTDLIMEKMKNEYETKLLITNHESEVKDLNHKVKDLNHISELKVKDLTHINELLEARNDKNILIIQIKDMQLDVLQNKLNSSTEIN
jgi:hypothetical protein